MDKFQDGEFAVGGVLQKTATRYLKVGLMVGAGLYFYEQFTDHRNKPLPAPAVQQPAVETPEIKPPDIVPKVGPEGIWKLNPAPMWQFEAPPGQPVAPKPESEIVV